MAAERSTPSSQTASATIASGSPSRSAIANAWLPPGRPIVSRYVGERVSRSNSTDALRAADVGVVASGTATLEAALARCPHVIFYRVHPLTARIVRGRILLPWVGLPNILAGKFVVPELIQDDATVENLAQAALNLFDDTVTRRRLEALFAGFAASLAADTGGLAADAVAAELRAAGVGC